MMITEYTILAFKSVGWLILLRLCEPMRWQCEGPGAAISAPIGCSQVLMDWTITEDKARAPRSRHTKR